MLGVIDAGDADGHALHHIYRVVHNAGCRSECDKQATVVGRLSTPRPVPGEIFLSPARYVQPF